jgi:hypothetical protein
MFIVGGNHQALQGAGERRHPHVNAAVVHFRRDASKQEPVTEQDVQVREAETVKSLGKTDFKAGCEVAFKDSHSSIEQPCLKYSSDTSSSYLHLSIALLSFCTTLAAFSVS